MNNKKKSLIFLVDDDALFLKTLEADFANFPEISVKTFATGELCLDSISEDPDVIVLDYYLNGIDEKAKNGIETLDKINTVNPLIPVIMLSSQDSIDVAVDCMKHKAFDYIVKSETAFLRLQKVIAYISHTRKTEAALNWYMERMS
jgi:two-component system OmpR family response regulator